MFLRSKCEWKNKWLERSATDLLDFDDGISINLPCFIPRFHLIPLSNRQTENKTHFVASIKRGDANILSSEEKEREKVTWKYVETRTSELPIINIILGKSKMLRNVEFALLVTAAADAAAAIAGAEAVAAAAEEDWKSCNEINGGGDDGEPDTDSTSELSLLSDRYGEHEEESTWKIASNKKNNFLDNSAIITQNVVIFII